MIRAAALRRRAQKQFLELDAAEEAAFRPICLNIGAGVEGQDVGIVYRQRGETRRGGHSLGMWL